MKRLTLSVVVLACLACGGLPGGAPQVEAPAEAPAGAAAGAAAGAPAGHLRAACLRRPVDGERPLRHVAGVAVLTETSDVHPLVGHVPATQGAGG